MDRTINGTSIMQRPRVDDIASQKKLLDPFGQSERLSLKLIVRPEHGPYFYLPLPANEGLLSVISVETSSPETSFHLFLFNREQFSNVPNRPDIIFEEYISFRPVAHFRPEQDFYRDETGQSRLYGGILMPSRRRRSDLDKKDLKKYLNEPVSISISVLFTYAVGESAVSHQKLPTKQVIAEFMTVKRHKRLKESSLQTYEGNLLYFEKFYPELTENQDDILKYLARFDGPTGRTKRNRQDELGQLYTFASQKYGISNPISGLPRPEITRKPIKTLSLAQVATLVGIDISDRDRAVLELLVGHGWRQIEIRRITAEDVRKISDGMIWVHGKEREEYTPILPETAELFKKLAEGLADHDLVISGRSHKELHERGMGKLVGRLFLRAGIEGITPHDLRRTFSSLVRKYSGDEGLAMRLIRDQIPQLNSRYISVSDGELIEGLLKYSPLRLVEKKSLVLKAGETPSKDGELVVEAGESRTPDNQPYSASAYPQIAGHTLALVQWQPMPFRLCLFR